MSKRVILLIVLSATIVASSCPAADEAVPTFSGRDQIDSAYKWDLTPIYASDDLWQADLDWVDQNLAQYDSFKGTLGKSAQNLLNCLTFHDAVGIKVGLLELYAVLSRDVNVADEKYQAMWDRYISLRSRKETGAAFIQPEILAIPNEELQAFFNHEPQLETYRHFIDDIVRLKQHVLPQEQETIVASAMPITSLSSDLYTLLVSADIEYPTIQDEDGNDITISPVQLRAALASSDRDFRRRAHQAITSPFIAHKNTFSALLAGNLKSNVFKARARHFETTLEAVMKPQNIPTDVYDNLILSVNEHLAPLHRWTVIKQKALGLEKVRPYDVWATIFPAEKKEYTYKQGRDIIIEAMKPLGSAFTDGVRKAFDERRIDVFETDGKRGGSYSTGSTYGADPYVLLNWHGQLSGLYALAHELGHNMHAHFSTSAQPYVYAQYPSFTGEVAALMAEVLLYEYMLERATTTRERLAYIEQYLNTIQLTFYWTCLLAEFERDIYDRVERGEALTAEELCQSWEDLYVKYWGDVFEMDETSRYSWAMLSHFYQFSFYVYQYATSIAAAEQIAARIRTEPGVATDDYLTFLTAGSSDYAINMLNKAGVDMSTQEPIVAVTTKMTLLLDEFERLMAEQ